MSYKYKNVVPWGRSYEEYRRMFSLTGEDLRKRIIGCGDGPAAFNKICNEQGGNVISVDPIYALSESQIRERIRETYDDVIAQTYRNTEKFIWNTIRSVAELGRIRMNAMNQFLSTYEEDRKKGRYVEGKFPELDFPDDRFNLALSSHFLFLYTDNLTYEFHIESIKEMMRVAEEARIFPLLDVNARRSPYVDRMITECDKYQFEIRQVDYEFQLGGNQMMVVTRKT
jgi:hypothetical protein